MSTPTTTWPKVCNPDTLDHHLHPTELVRKSMECLHGMFPRVPLNGRYWSLQVPSGRRQQARLEMWCDEEIAFVMNFEAEASLGLLRVPGDNLTASVERMALANAHWSDIQGWLFHAKTVYDKTLRPPLRFQVEREFTVRDGLRGDIFEYGVGVKVEMPYSLKAIRPFHEGDPKRPLDLEDGSWQLVNNGASIIPQFLRELKPIYIHRYTVEGRYGFFDLRKNSPVRFPVGCLVEALSDGSAIRRVNPKSGRMAADIENSFWAYLDGQGTGSGTLKHAIQSGVLTEEG